MICSKSKNHWDQFKANVDLGLLEIFRAPRQTFNSKMYQVITEATDCLTTEGLGLLTIGD